MRRCIPSSALVLVAALLAPATRAYASPINYTDSAIASGTLNGVAYTNALLTFTATGDTDGVVVQTLSGLQVYSNPVSVDFTVAGGGAGTLTGLYSAFSNATQSLGGILRGTPANSSLTLLGLFNGAFASYQLATAIGPLSGSEFTGNRGSTTAFASSAGDLVISSTSGNVTFTATTTTAVPEPTTLAMAGIGLAAAGLVARRRAKA